MSCAHPRMDEGWGRARLPGQIALQQHSFPAVAHSMLTAAYHVLRDDVDYRDLGPGFFYNLNREAIQRRCLRQLDRLGYTVTIAPQLAEAA